MSDVLSTLLRGEFQDPDGGGRLSVPTRTVVIEGRLAGREVDLLTGCGLTGELLLVADAATWDALGARTFEAIRAARPNLRKHIFPTGVHPATEAIEAVQQAAHACQGLIAIGSGSLNDITKSAAHRLKQPYVVFGTAASMNGYTSVNASITEKGHKRSIAATAPVAAFFDLEVLVAAPVRLTRAGVGDSLCRSTVQTDWLLSQRLLGTAYRRAPFELLRDEEAVLLSQMHELAAGSTQAMAHLVRTLILSGFGMTICGGSYPASQGEHLISHHLEMFADPQWPETLHGEHIAVTTLTMARLQQAMLRQSSLSLRPTMPSEAEFQKQFGAHLGPSFASEYKRKVETARAAGASSRLALGWVDIRQELAKVHLAPEHLEAALATIGAPTTPADLGIPVEAYRTAVRRARLTRDRYTFLDLAADTGLEHLLDAA